MRLKFLGGCKQIGGQAVYLENDGYYLFDYGIEMGKKPSLPELDFSVRDLNVVFLTHAHLDHSGGVPYLFSGIKTPNLVMTPPTRILSKILFRDMLKLSGYYLPFGQNEVRTALNRAIMVKYSKNKWKKMNGVKYLTIDAGHIPGSASFIVEVNGKRIMYTGDINHISTRLLDGMKNKFPKIDYVIMESTYGATDHPERETVEKELVEYINNIIDQEGTVLVPAFGVGRSQEVMCLCTYYNIRYPIFIDGMARKVSRALMRYVNYLRDTSLYKKAIRITNFISRGKKKIMERRNAVSMPSVIIAPSGMLKGGTAIFYADNLKDSVKNAIYLVSFQLPGSLGRQVLESKLWKDGNTKIKAEVKHFPLSSHSGRSELLSFVDTIDKKSNGNTTFFHIHGEEENINAISNELVDRGIESIIPNKMEDFEI
ncbi:MAG: MBL fold metallo-hydrolase [Candidatus Lokiarchaeota archaeon]|nr:MBL fold metallo-hydrolase [Candidatus Lokiarchaeota archaeon]